MYYLRSKAAVDPIKFTLSDKHQRKYVRQDTMDAMDLPSSNTPRTSMTDEIIEPKKSLDDINTMMDVSATGPVCTMEEGCVMCGSWA